MTATATYGATGTATTDGVLSGVKWGVSTLTFSFPTSSSFYGASYGSGENLNGFRAFNSTQQAAVRTVLKNFAAVSNLNFTEVTESATVHGELRYAYSNSPSTAWAYYPSTNPVGGDAWFNNARHYYDSPVAGNYAYLTMLHETGHALGLKHPHEARGAFNAMPSASDSLEFTVMSYRSYVGASTSTGYTNGSSSYPQSLMMIDIQAIQKLYGADYTTNATDSVYSWSTTTGQMLINGVVQNVTAGNKVFMTVWDGGGNDTYDLSNYTTGVKIDLTPGGWTTTSATQLASLGGGQVARGNIANALLFDNNTASLIENATGGIGADTITGNQANNVLRGNGGNDAITGGAGTDTAVYSGRKADYRWTLTSSDTWTVTDLRTGTPDGTDTLKGMEVLRFSDGSVTLASTTTTTTVPTPTVTNTAPVATPDGYAVGKNTKLTVTAAKGVLVNDSDANGDKLTAKLVSGPSSGSLSFRSDGSFDYTPKKNFVGVVSFTYQASDGKSPSVATKVSLSVGLYASAKGKGGESEHDHDHDHEENMEDDQVPAPVDTVSQIISVLTRGGFEPARLGALPKALVPVFASADHMLGTLSTALSQLNDGLAGNHAPASGLDWPGLAGDDTIDIAGLPPLPQAHGLALI